MGNAIALREAVTIVSKMVSRSVEPATMTVIQAVSQVGLELIVQLKHSFMRR
jgi:hypothetical protein